MAHLHNIVYRITNNLNGRFYVGVHETDDLDDGYMGSSDILYSAIRKYGKENFSREILFDFSSRAEMYAKETEMVDEKFLMQTDPAPYNVRLGGDGGWEIMRGKTVAIHPDGRHEVVLCDDPRLLTGEILQICAGRSIFLNIVTGEHFLTKKDDPRVLSGELVGVASGKAVFVDSAGKRYFIRTDDPIISELGLVSAHKGKIIARDKDGKTHYIDNTDERFLSGELTHINKGKSVVRGDDGKYLSVQKDDPRIASGELVSINKGKIPAVNVLTGERRQVDADSEEYKSGEWVSVFVGKICAKNRETGKTTWVSKEEYYAEGTPWESIGKFTNCGKLWVYREETGESRRIAPDELAAYLTDGWKEGRRKRKYPKRQPREQHFATGLRWFFHDELRKNARFFADQTEQLFAAGWRLGKRRF